jgi:hypothetical protein
MTHSPPHFPQRRSHLPRALGLAVVAGGAILHVLAFGLVHIQRPANLPPASNHAFVRFMTGNPLAADSAQQEQSLLLDSAALFMPGPWSSASNAANPASLQRETEVFSVYPPRTRAPSFARPAPFWQTPAPDWPSVIGESLPPPPLERDPLPPPLITGSSLSVEALRIDQPATRWLRPVPLAELPPLPARWWDPVVVHAHVANGRLLGAPSLIASSGVVEWDTSILRLLGSRTFYAGLADGYWQVSVLP